MKKSINRATIPAARKKLAFEQRPLLKKCPKPIPGKEKK